jgi:hypothetical protein
LATRLLMVAWLCFSAGPAVHYLLIVHPLPDLPGIADLAPRLVTGLLAQTYFIGTVIIVASLWVAVRAEVANRAEQDLAAVAA